MFLVAHIKIKDVFLVVNTIHVKHLAKFMKSFGYLYDAEKLDFQLITQDELIDLVAYQVLNSKEAFEAAIIKHIEGRQHGEKKCKNTEREASKSRKHLQENLFKKGNLDENFVKELEKGMNEYQKTLKDLRDR